MIEQFLNYWNGLEMREKRMLIIGGIAVALTLVYLVIIEPLVGYRASLQSQVERKRESVAWMQGASDQLARQPTQAPTGDVDTGSLLTLVDSSARNTELGQAMKRVQQNGEAAVRVRFEAAGFDDLLLWLGRLEQQFGVTIDQITLERAEKQGRVDATITLTRGASQG